MEGSNLDDYCVKGNDKYQCGCNITETELSGGKKSKNRKSKTKISKSKTIHKVNENEKK